MRNEVQEALLRVLLFSLAGEHAQIIAVLALGVAVDRTSPVAVLESGAPPRMMLQNCPKRGSLCGAGVGGGGGGRGRYLTRLTLVVTRKYVVLCTLTQVV